MNLNRCLLFCLLLLNGLLFGQKVDYDPIFELEDYNFVLGTQGIGGKYQFTDDSKLVEQAKHIRSMGSNILKISLGRNTTKSYNLKEVDANTTLELFKAIPDFKGVFDMDSIQLLGMIREMIDENT